MNEDKFYNDTFEFDFTVIFFDSAKTKAIKKLNKLRKKIGYKKDEIELKHMAGLTIGNSSDYYILINAGELKRYYRETVKKEILVTLAHECNHIREFILNDIQEKEGKRETEVAMRISDWCFRKCMNTKYFKSMLK